MKVAWIKKDGTFEFLTLDQRNAVAKARPNCALLCVNIWRSEILVYRIVYYSDRQSIDIRHASINIKVLQRVIAAA
jgi:hypothetical protein